jgi:hypothetical protein
MNTQPIVGLGQSGYAQRIDNTHSSVYSQKDLKEMHKQTARMLRAKHKGFKVTVHESFLRVSNNSTQLVTPYWYESTTQSQRTDTFTIAL